MRSPTEIYNDVQFKMQEAAKELAALDTRLGLDLSKQLDSTIYSLQRHGLNQWGIKTEPVEYIYTEATYPAITAPLPPAAMEPAKKLAKKA